MKSAMDRRCFHRCIVAGAAALTAPSTFAGGPGLVDIDRGLAVHFVYETRLIDLIDASGTVFPHASRFHAITADVTPVWYNHLDRLWRQRYIRTAGLTFDAEFFVLKTLASDHGYRVTREQHDGEKVRWLLEPVPTARVAQCIYNS